MATPAENLDGSVRSTRSEEQAFRVSVRNGVARITLCRETKCNSLPRGFWRDLPRTMRELEHQPEVRVVLIDALGEHFSAGIDLGLLASLDKLGEGLESSRKAEQLRRIVLSLQATLNCLHDSPLPVVCAIQGQCIGGALDLVCAADIRIASTDASFVPMEINLGFVPDLGTVQRLSTLVTPAVANDWLMTGRPVSGEEARSIGFVSRCEAGPAALAQAAQAIASQIAEKSPVAVRGLKENLRFTREHGVRAGLQYVAAWQSGVFPGSDLAEAMQARQKHVSPRFSGLATAAPVPGADESF